MLGRQPANHGHALSVADHMTRRSGKQSHSRTLRTKSTKKTKQKHLRETQSSNCQGEFFSAQAKTTHFHRWPPRSRDLRLSGCAVVPTSTTPPQCSGELMLADDMLLRLISQEQQICARFSGADSKSGGRGFFLPVAPLFGRAPVGMARGSKPRLRDGGRSLPSD